MAKTASLDADILAAVSTKELRPFLWLRPTAAAGELTPEVHEGLELLRELVAERAPWIARALVDLTLAQDRERRRGRPEAPPISVLNRRRRSARALIETLLAGRVDADALRQTARIWLPQLSASGPEPADFVPIAQQLLEFVRGSFTALIFNEPADNLVPRARALHALECVLARHLHALRRGIEGDLLRVV